MQEANSMTTGVSIRVGVLFFLAFLCLVALLNLNTFDNDWTFDDRGIVVENPDIRSLENFFTNSYPGRPVRELSYMVDYKLFGFEPSWYHLQQIFLHALNGFFLFLIFSRIGIRRLYACAGSILFLVHPVQVESVANIGHRKELLPLAFALAALLLVDRLRLYSGARKFSLSVLALILFLLAFYSNQTVATFPLVVIAYVVLFRENTRALSLKQRLAVFSVAGVLISAGIWYVVRVGNVDQNLGIILSQNLTSGSGYWPLFWGCFSVIWYDLVRIVLPFNLAPLYAVPLQGTPFHVPTIAGILLLALCVVVIIAWWRKHPQISFAFLWMLLLHIPVSNFYPLGYLLADRYLYMVMPGVALLFAWCIQAAVAKWRGIYPLAGTILVIVSCAWLTYRQNDVWQNQVSLFMHTVQVSPLSADAQMMLGDALLEARQPALAKVHLLEALRLNPYLISSYRSLGVAEQSMGNLPAANNYFRMYKRYSMMK